MLKIQDYNIGDLIKIKNIYFAVVTDVDNHSLQAVAINYPNKENQIFVITERYVDNITKVTHE